MKTYDYIIVGAGLYGATFAYKAKQANKKCLVIDKRSHLGGNIYCEKQKESMYTNMVHIFFIHRMKKFGILLTQL